VQENEGGSDSSEEEGEAQDTFLTQGPSGPLAKSGEVGKDP